MVASVRTLILSCLILVGLSNPGTAEPALPTNADALVEEGIAAYDAEDYQRAKDILLPLAEAGDAKAMNIIGLMHDGTPVFPDDPIIECDWYEKSARSGFPSGMYNLSICYSHGDGRKKDPDLMLKWRSSAAKLGHKASLINLAAMDKNRGKHYRSLMLQAVDNGSTFAKVSLWLRGYSDDVHDVTFSEIVCVSWNIILLDRSKYYCD